MCLSRYVRHLFIYALALVCIWGCETGVDETQQISLLGADSTLTCVESQLPTPKAQKRIYREIEGAMKHKQLDTIFRNKRDKNRFNGCVLVAQKKVILYKECFGEDCNAKKEPEELTFQSKFQLASMTKTFTAVAILKLIEEQKLSLEDSIQKFFPEFPYKGISIELLLNHRSGLPYYAYVFHDSIKWAKYGPTNEEVLRWFIERKPKPYNKPDRSFSYNNTNYMMLALVIEKVSGMSYERYMRENIFLPLGMKNTFVFSTDNDSLLTNITCGHERNELVQPDYFDLVVGDKGIYSTIEDLFLWYLALNSECILKRESLALAFTPYSFESPGTKNYGLGFRMRLKKDTKEPQYIYHNGWWKGYNTMFWMIPDKEVVIVILSNHRSRTVYEIKNVLKVFEPEQFLEEEDE